MSTVGYGDIYCTTGLGRAFIVLFILIGLVSYIYLYYFFLFINLCFVLGHFRFERSNKTCAERSSLSFPAALGALLLLLSVSSRLK